MEKTIVFLDIEVSPATNKVTDIGGIKDNNNFHNNSNQALIDFVKGTTYVCGHNFLKHDFNYIGSILKTIGITENNIIDTLNLSPLLFPEKPYHALVKDDKLQTEELNNPLNDSIKAKNLFYDEVNAFIKLDDKLKRIYYGLLNNKMEFHAFFSYMNYSPQIFSLESEIRDRFKYLICEHANLSEFIKNNSIELAYSLSLIKTKNYYSITPPWVLMNYPLVYKIMYALRGKPCLSGCYYCNESFNIYSGLKKYFGYDSYREYDGEPLQEKAVRAAVDNKSFLAVFPTGGGKSITFQVPALLSGMNSRSLTVVISPLQSLMKDQVDNLEEKNITDAVTINGLLDPIERAKALERVEDGSASILYISPESLRSKTIEHLLLGRNIARFVIDEAHCFSAWGQDFRVDYLYIGEFIKSIREKKRLDMDIPVSCFTATAKQKVIEDIKEYFKNKLDIDLEVFSASTSRKNLHYEVINSNNDEDKYNILRNLIDSKKCPTIVYVSRTNKAYKLAERLTKDGYIAKPYHGKMDKQEKSQNQDMFKRGEVDVMVATSAFGMGVDKKDVGLVIHFDISDSLENYIQEAGRAGRDESINADCYVLFNDEDLNKHFILLNQTKLSIQEIQQIWKAIKDITKFRAKFSQSALELARKAGWDDSVIDIETRVKTAIAALEEAGYVKRGQNMPRIYADSILVKTAREAIFKIEKSLRFTEKEKEEATRIVKRLFSSKSIQAINDNNAETRIDYISDHLGIPKEEVIHIIILLREENILADTKDMTAFIKKGQNKNRSLSILNVYYEIEKLLIKIMDEEEKVFQIKEINENIESIGCKNVTPNKIKTIFNIWSINNLIKRKIVDYNKNQIAIKILNNSIEFENIISKRYNVAAFILNYLYRISIDSKKNNDLDTEEILVEFSLIELKEEFNRENYLLGIKASIKEIEEALFYLSRIEAIKIEGSFLVIYNGLSIERLEKDNKRRYKIEDYQKMDQFYQNKIQQIHIVGEYAHKMLEDYKAAIQFVEDYFQLNYSSFLNKYFKGSRQDDIKKNITPTKFRQLFGQLSPVQLKIVNDNKSKYIVVLAGPGSGKTRILVHKLASLILMEDVKSDQLLMVTFSRAAVTEFKKRLLKLIGNAANYIEIKTFHSYCFDLLGRIGNLEKSVEVIKEAINKIENGEVEMGRITKTVLVIDEAQDMDEHEFKLVKTLMQHNDDMRVIAVGDDDQNIFEFRGSSSKYLEEIINDEQAVMYELVENYRSKMNLVDYSNQFVKKITHRLKKTPIIANKKENGSITLYKYKSRNLITPLVNSILKKALKGSTCVLTKTNDEAMQITGMLIKNGFKAKLIQSNEGFNLYNIQEIRYFIDELNLSNNHYIIDDDIWAKAKDKLKMRFENSANFELCMNIIKDFELINTKNKYKSDFEVFIKESKIEDFSNENMDTIYISTIHKAKGKEFDNVFITLDRFNTSSDEYNRMLYVGLTRAKANIDIHYNDNYLDNIKTESLNIIYDNNIWEKPMYCAFQLTYNDVWLDYFFSCKAYILNLTSGDKLSLDEEGCINKYGKHVVKFSKKFKEKIELLKKYGYVMDYAKIKFIVYWKKEDTDKEIPIILPEIHMKAGD